MNKLNKEYYKELSKKRLDIKGEMNKLETLFITKKELLKEIELAMEELEELDNE